jgi:hypothetical protein
MFRTGILSPTNKNKALNLSVIHDYEDVQAELRDRHKDSDGRQLGDPMLAAHKIMDTVELMYTSRRPMPQRIPLGSDAIAVIKRKCTETLEELRGWETFASSTDIVDDSSLAPSYYRL